MNPKAGVAAAAVAIAVLPLLVVLLVTGTATEDRASGATAPGAAGAALNSDEVPAAYAPWISQAGQICPEITAPIIAAQIFKESSFRDHGLNGAGAAGPGQFLAGTFATYGVDADNDGKKDLHSVADAVVTTGRMDCALVKELAGKLPGEDPAKLALAGYHDGAGAVIAAGGVPASPVTQQYVSGILQLARTRFASQGVAGGTVVGASGGWVNPVAKGWTVGAAFHQAGTWSKGWHTGYDFAIAVGTPVVAAGAGKVTEINPMDPAWGNQVVISHGKLRTDDGRERYVESTYNHLHDFQVKVGDTVTAGQLVGHVGMTGRTFGPHLHFEMHASDTPGRFNWNSAPDTDFIDPWKWLQSHRGPAAPAPASNTGGGVSSAVVQKAIAVAAQQVGKPYVMGAVGPDRFDCSGLMIWAYDKATSGAIDLSGTRTTQIMAGSSSAARRNFSAVSDAAKQPGDLIFFQTEGAAAGWSHVGIYVGKVDGHNTMIEAANPSKGVVVTQIDSGYYGPDRPRTIRRVRGI